MEHPNRQSTILTDRRLRLPVKNIQPYKIRPTDSHLNQLLTPAVTQTDQTIN